MITNYYANSLLSVLSGKTQNVSAGTIFVGLSSKDPLADASELSEPVTSSYFRVLLGNYSQSYTQKMGSVVDGEVSNKEIIYFPETPATPSNPWGTLTHFCLFDASSGGHLLAYGPLDTPITPGNEEIPIIRVGSLTLSIHELES